MKQKFTLIGLALPLFLLISTLTACGGKEESISKSGFYFDTVIHITLYDKDAGYALDHCMEMAESYEQTLSDSLPDSDVSRINAHPGQAVAVAPDTAELIRLALDYGALSEGRFDITIGRLADLWSFEEENIPSEEKIRAALSHVDYRKVEVEGDTVTLHDKKSAIDLGGIAKGFIADRMKEYLESEGIRSGLINLGGNVLTLGEKPSHSSYTIGIQKPFSEDGTPILSIELLDRSVVTSGTYQRYFKKDGRIYHHIIDTATGFPCDNGLASVSILSDSSTEGDALSTTVFLMGLENGLRFVESREDIEAVFITTEDEIVYSSGFKDHYRSKEY
ncbi:MAG: FAD:protein FMN transferase [Lachnospiraceae bacterium]|nr:FAD:protein FMN transferase [Lachnospiraceae bacterium]